MLSYRNRQSLSHKELYTYTSDDPNTLKAVRVIDNTLLWHVLRSLRSRNFALLWLGQTISLLGDGAFDIALSWQILLLTGSGTAMGVVLTARMIPTLIFLLLGGAVADRLPRRLVMLWSDGGRAVIVLLIATMGWLHLMQLWHLVVLALCFGVVDGFFRPAYRAIFPELVPTENLPSANSLTALSEQLSLLLGPALGALFVALSSPAFAFAFDGLTFVVSTLCLIAMRVPTSVFVPVPAAPALAQVGESLTLAPAYEHTFIATLKKALGDIHDGLRYVAGSRWFLVGLPLATIGNVGFVAMVVAMPKLVHDTYGTGVWLLGVLEMANALGALVATFLVGQIPTLRGRGLLMYLALIVSSAALIVFGLPLPRAAEPLVSSIANAFVGFGLAAFGILWITVMQEMVPGDKLGRVTSIDILGAKCLTPIGYALGGLMTDRIGPPSVFIAGGLLNLVLGIIALGVRDIRRLQ